MLFEFIAVIVAGFAGAGVALLANKLLAGRLPKWTVPVAAGAAMLAITISNEYGWFTRTSTALPDGLIVAETVENRALYRPWTYVFPFVHRFIAVDTVSVRTNPSFPDLRLVDIYAFTRWVPPSKVSVAVDCAKDLRAEIVEGVEIAEDGSIAGARWRSVGPEDGIVATTCRSGV